MLVPAPVLDVGGPAVGLRGEVELGLEQGPEPRPGAVVVRDGRVRVAVDVVDRPVRPAAEGEGHELAHLADQVGAPEAPGREHQDLVVLGLEQVAGERVPAAAALGAGDHRRSAVV
ncbi:MAG: hypothetical protein DI590_16655 [Methylorubrum populi]|nr:MAG: hypothetical protein DI590_16655 [Methylorubrum populi]